MRDASILQAYPSMWLKLLGPLGVIGGVENSLHWVLDVQMTEDSPRIRAGNSAENMARIRRLTINMLKNHEVDEKDKH